MSELIWLSEIFPNYKYLDPFSAYRHSLRPYILDTPLASFVSLDSQIKSNDPQSLISRIGYVTIGQISIPPMIDIPIEFWNYLQIWLRDFTEVIRLTEWISQYK